MKTKLLVNAFLLILVMNLSANTLEANREIELKTNRTKILRSLPVLPVSAYLNGSTIYINFIQNVNIISMSIMNVDSGEVIYFDDQQASQNICISLSGEEVGNYRLEINIDNGVIWGEFVY